MRLDRAFIWIAFAAALFAVTSRPVEAQTKLRVVASFSILADVVRQVGGDRIEVASLVGSGGDAHVYEASPADSAKIAAADLVIINGLNFEPWADRLVKAAKYSKARLVASKGIKALVTAGQPDPHAWQDVENVKLYVANIRDALIGADPAGRADYEGNAAAYRARLDKLHAGIKAAFADIAPAKRKVITSHDAFTYYGDAYGIVFHAPQGLSTEAEPTARDVARLVRQIKAEKVTAVFVENITDPRLVAQIAREAGVTLGGTLYSDGLAREGEATTYVGLMEHNTRLLASAMR
jgi:zinc/manganese transport system substrate-binding protein